MRILNLQDGVVKSPLVQQLQERAVEVARAQDISQAAFNDELTRRADEVIGETNQLEHDGIRDDQERQAEQRRRRRRRKAAADQDTVETRADGEEPASDHHRIDITI